MSTLQTSPAHRLRRGLLAVMAIGLASVMNLAGAAGAGAAVRSAQAGPLQVEHWGFFFGDRIMSDEDVTLKPHAISLPAPVAQLGTSNSSQYALLTNGTVWAWGQGTNGQLGDGSTSNSFATPVQVHFPAGVTIASIPTDAMPFDSGLAVDTTGTAWAWGLNKDGWDCRGNKQPEDLPVPIPLPHVTAIAGAGGHAVYDSNGTLYSCGNNRAGVLGDGSKNASEVPVKVKHLSGASVVALVAAYDNEGALLSSGAYYDWGYDAAGQLGNGTVGQASDVPVHVHLPGPVTQAAEGGSGSPNGQTLVRLASGRVFAWGNDRWAQLGDGKFQARPSPKRIFPPAGVTYATLATGGNTSYAIATDGSVYAWGAGVRGQIGNGRRETVTTPVKVETSANLISSTAGDVEVAQAP